MLTVGLDLSSEPSRPTGVGRYALCLARALGRLADPGLRTLAFAPPELGVIGLATWPTPFGEHSSGLRRAFQQVALPTYAWAQGVDILHSVNNLAPLSFPGPIVLSFQDAKLYRAAAGGPLLRRLYRRGMHRRSARTAARVLVASRWSKQEAVETLGVAPDRVRVVPFGVEASRFDPRLSDLDTDRRIRASYGLANAEYVLVVATREPAKNLFGALQAFASIAPRHPGLRLALCGGRGWGDQDLEGLASRLGVRDLVLPLGYVEDDELPALYRGARAFLFPSRVEGFGLPILEAFAAGTPVVTSTATACPETAGDAALLADPDSVESIGAALEVAVNEGADRAALVARGLERAAEMTWERTALETAEVYREAWAVSR